MGRDAKDAPELEGYQVVKRIGSGGFADVFLYRELGALDGREVAVKVLDTSALPAGTPLDHFRVEAQLMAKVRHPNIVSVFGVGDARDGRPYISMEYYPGANFDIRARAARMSVPEALSVGVRISSAVETAHQANIIHHDIKPSNILTSEYNTPGLTDFGIAVVQEHASEGADALSIPWASPEALRGEATGRASDVYSLGATVYTLLAGRAPYEQPGGDNSNRALITRGKAGNLPPTGRADVPRSLERALARAMSPDPTNRPESAAEFARNLQVVETELGLPGTALVLRGSPEQAHPSTRDDGEATSARQIRISPRAEAPAAHRKSSVSVGPEPERAAERHPQPPPAHRPDERTRRPVRKAEPLGDTILKNRSSADEFVTAPRVERPTIALLSGAAVLAIAAIIGLVVAFSGGDQPGPEDDGDLVIDEIIDGTDDESIVPRPDPVVDLVGVSVGDVNRFTWSASDEASAYNVIVDAGGRTRQTETSFETDSACIEVQVVRDDGVFSDPTRGCV